MNRVLGISFGAERIYCAVVNRENGAYRLEEATAFLPAAEPESPGSTPHIQRVVGALRAALDEMGRPCKYAAVSFPSTWMLAQTFPAPLNISESHLQERVAWELRQHYPGADVESFAAMIYPLAGTGGAAEYLCFSVEKNLLQRVREMFRTLDVELAAAELTPIAAHEALAANYPETADAPAAMIEFAGDATIVTAVRGEELLAYEELPAGDDGRAWRETLARAERAAHGAIAHVYLHGELLTRQALDETRRRLQRDVRRFNAFRRFAPSRLSPRALEYCRRTAHLFVAPAGVAVRAIKTN